IEQHKMDWAKKIVRIELDPKLLQSEQIGESTYRGFVKDTAGHYGRIEFPHDSLVKLGFLKKTVSGTHAWEEFQKMDAAGRTQGAPIALYIEIIPLGEKPAARAVAVGSKISKEPDGTVTYSWCRLFFRTCANQSVTVLRRAVITPMIDEADALLPNKPLRMP